MLSSIARILGALMLVLTTFLGRPAFAAEILLFNSAAEHDRVGTALDDLGLAYTVADYTNLNSLLTGGTSWDLVVLDVPSGYPTGLVPNLIDYIKAGGRVLMGYWELQSTLDEHRDLAKAFGVGYAGTFMHTPAIVAWEPLHPIFAGITSPIVGWTDDYWADDGDTLYSMGAQLVAGTTPSPIDGAGMIAVGNDGRTIYNGFLFDNLPESSVQLIANQIQFLLPPPSQVPLPSTLALGIIGLLGFATSRRGRTPVTTSIHAR